MYLTYYIRLFYRVLITIILLLPIALNADDIVLMANKMSPVLLQLKAEFEQKTNAFKVSIFTQDHPTVFPENSYIVNVGMDTISPFFRKKAAGIVSILVTKNQNLQLLNQSAIYVEPPLERQFRLALQLFPNSKIGILIADERAKKQIYKDLTEQQYSVLNIVTLSDYESLNQALFEVLKKSDVLLGVYDKKIYNSKNIKNILITSYRQQKVLIGPSKAYLKAGSFASTFSNLSHITHRLIDILVTHKSTGLWLAAGYNPYYEIVFNKQVGNSLNIQFPDPETVLNNMRGHNE